MKYDLSILIPARSEQFLARTVEDLLKNMRGNTEIIVVLDGAWADPPLIPHERLTVVYNNKAVGQRAATNQACRLSTAKWVMKIDAHCAVDEGFDVKIIEGAQDNWTIIPTMYNLHVFDWKCKQCGNQWYQGPTPTACKHDEKKGKDPCTNTSEFERVMIWAPRWNRKSEFYRFDTEPHFQYHGARAKHPEATGDFVDTMSAQGSCFVLTRERYWYLNISDESLGNWGNQGLEVACKTWLSGGRLVTNRKTWYAHLFRTQGGDFGFPYPLGGNSVKETKNNVRALFYENKYDKQIHSLSWLIEKFKPLDSKSKDGVPDWHTPEGKPMLDKINKAGEEFYARKGVTPLTFESHPDKGIIYYTDNTVNLKLGHKVKELLLQTELPIVSVSLKPMEFGRNIHMKGMKRGYLTMAKQILAGLEASTADFVFFCEHDVLYHPSHFDFMPSHSQKYYYNTNVWRIRATDGHALYCDSLQQLSGLCANRETLIKHYRERVKRLEDNADLLSNCCRAEFDAFGFPKAYGLWQEKCLKCGKECEPIWYNEPDPKYVRAMGFEPGTHGRPERIDDLKAESWMSQYPNLDIRHDSNLTPSRWSKDQFRNERYTRGWKESKLGEIPGWKGESVLSTTPAT